MTVKLNGRSNTLITTCEFNGQFRITTKTNKRNNLIFSLTENGI